MFFLKHTLLTLASFLSVNLLYGQDLEKILQDINAPKIPYSFEVPVINCFAADLDYKGRIIYVYTKYSETLLTFEECAVSSVFNQLTISNDIYSSETKLSNLSKMEIYFFPKVNSRNPIDAADVIRCSAFASRLSDGTVSDELYKLISSSARDSIRRQGKEIIFRNIVFQCWNNDGKRIPTNFQQY